LLEGEEESGSPNLGGLVEAAGDELKADIALICDTERWNAETPAIVSMLRGLSSQEFTVTAASRDLHSGAYGSAARNPLQVVAEIVASFRRPDGGVAIAGFYDDVVEVPASIRAAWDGLGFDGEAYLGEVGLSVPAGEADRSVLEQLWSRPTCEVNGMWGGYTGEGTKTVIPSTAHAKVTFRLVADQDPGRIEAAFRDHVRARVPPDCAVEFEGLGWGRAVSVATDGPLFARAASALAEEWGTEPVVIGSGGSIPVVGLFSERLGMDSLLIGFARDDDNIHSPNEKYDLESFRRGIRSWIRILGALADSRAQ
jgi:acetylornithine deacetylase/succinyl-diaminopimelate desuccinylase-like protein